MSGPKSATMAERLAAQSQASEQGRGARPFLAVWLPSLVTIIGTGASTFALSWWITRSPAGGAHLGTIVGVSSAVSLLVVTALSGVLDRSDRRRTVVCLLVILALPVAALIGVFGLRQSLVAVLAAGLCYMLLDAAESLYLATMETVAVDVAPPTWPSARTAMLTQMHSQVERVIAPTIAGTLITAGMLQAVPVVALAGVIAVLVVVYASRRHIDGVSQRVSDSLGDPSLLRPAGLLQGALRDAVASMRLIRSFRDLIFLVQLGVLTNLVVFPFYAVLPAFITEYAVPARSQAVLYTSSATAYGLGMLAGTLLLLRYRKRGSARRALDLATLCFAVICAVLVAATILPWPQTVVGAMAVNGALFVVLVAVGGAIWLNHTPAQVRVRVFSLRRLTVFSSIPVGTVLMGVGGAALGYREFIRAMVVVVLIALAAAWFRFRRRFTDDDAQQERHGPS